MKIPRSINLSTKLFSFTTELKQSTEKPKKGISAIFPPSRVRPHTKKYPGCYAWISFLFLIIPFVVFFVRQRNLAFGADLIVHRHPSLRISPHSSGGHVTPMSDDADDGLERLGTIVLEFETRALTNVVLLTQCPLMRFILAPFHRDTSLELRAGMFFIVAGVHTRPAQGVCLQIVEEDPGVDGFDFRLG